MVRPRDKQARLDEIISLITNYEEIQYTTIKQKIKLSDNVLSRYLKQLLNDDVLTFRRNGKNKFYKLSEKAIQDTRYKKIQAISKFRLNCNLRMLDIGIDYDINKRIFDNVEKTITTLFFKFIFEGLDTGNNLFPNFGFDDFIHMTVCETIEWILGYDVPDNMKNAIENYDITRIFKIFSEIDLNDLQIDRFEELSDYILNRHSGKNYDISNL